MSFRIEVDGGKQVKLPTAGKYCDRDIFVTGNGYTDTDLQVEYDAGVAAARGRCAAEHFVCSFTGDGSDTAAFHMPFEPDVIQIFGFDPVVMNTRCMMSFFYDRRALGQCAGYTCYGNGSGNGSYSLFSDAKAALRYLRTEDGTATVKGIGSSNAVVPFGAGFLYTVVAVKYAPQTEKERITAFVNRLTGSGTVSLQQAKVAAAFTDDEWAALIAAKPNWTFTMI